MLENAADSVKRYAPPSQRNRVLNRKNSAVADCLERTSHSQGSDWEKNHNSYPKTFSNVDLGEMSAHNEKRFSGLIAIDGCCTSDAARFLNKRWVAAVSSSNDPMTDSSEKPVLYSGASTSSWGHTKSSYQMDFLSELQRAIQNTGGTVHTPSTGAHFSS